MEKPQHELHLAATLREQTVAWAADTLSSHNNAASVQLRLPRSHGAADEVAPRSSAGDTGRAGGRPLARGSAPVFGRIPIMKKALLGISLFLTSCITFSPVMVQPEASEGLKAAALHTWKLTNPGHVYGSSCFPVTSQRLDNGLWKTVFVTAAHVTDGEPETGWKVSRDTEREVSGGMFVARHPTKDVSLVLFLTDEAIEVIPIDARPLQFMENVWTIGYPAGQHRVITQGIVSRRNMASTDAFRGNSGGPVVDYQGNVRGIAHALVFQRSGGQLFIVQHAMKFLPLADVASWLKSFNINTNLHDEQERHKP